MVSDKIPTELIFIFVVAENAIENMIGPDWKKRWIYWKNRTQEQVGTEIPVFLCWQFAHGIYGLLVWFSVTPAGLEHTVLPQPLIC